jgi:hypothetical protein
MVVRRKVEKKKTQRERDLDRLAEIRELDAVREFRRMGNVKEHNANVVRQSANAERARTEQNKMTDAGARRQRPKNRSK